MLSREWRISSETPLELGGWQYLSFYSHLLTPCASTASSLKMLRDQLRNKQKVQSDNCYNGVYKPAR